jgi:hypothetical protein
LRLYESYRDTQGCSGACQPHRPTTSPNACREHESPEGMAKLVAGDGATSLSRAGSRYEGGILGGRGYGATAWERRSPKLISTTWMGLTWMHGAQHIAPLRKPNGYAGMQPYTIWIEAENWAPGQWNPEDDNSDAIVTFQDGSRWGATFFSYQNIRTLVERWKLSGE